MFKYILILCLMFSMSSCFLFRKASTTTTTDQLSTTTSVAKGDTLVVVVPDSVPATPAQKTTILSKIFSGKKVKNKGTIIIQTGEKAIAAPVEKAKAPVAVSQEPATSTAITKPKNSAVTTGHNSPASATQKEKAFDWSWVLLGLLVVVVFFLYKKLS